MSARNKRFAGMRLAAEPVENISEDLNSALGRLNELSETRADSSDINKAFPVMGVPNTRININASRGYIPRVSDDVTAFGNPDQLRLIKEKANGNVYNLAWSVDGAYESDGRLKNSDRVKIARQADRRFSEALKSLPDGSIVMNSPVGASSGDYSRADIYMRKGFGPLQGDLEQYGIIENGAIKPLSPFVPDSEYSLHLADRARAAGDTELASAISQEIERRKGVEMPFNGKPQKQAQYNDYPDDYDYDYYDDEGPPPPITAAQFNESIDRSLEPQIDGLGRNSDNHLPGVDVRQRTSYMFNNLDNGQTVAADDLTPLVISEGVRRLRERQEQQIREGMNPFMVANANLVNQAAPRTAPQRITVEDLESARNAPYSYRGMMGDRRVPADTPLDQRRQVFAESLRDQMATFPTGWDGDVNHNRNMAKRDLTNIYQDPATGQIVAQQLYDPNDIEMFRQWQANQAQNWPIPPIGTRQAPPILDNQGRAMGPAQSDRNPDALYQETATPLSFRREESLNRDRRGPQQAFDPYNGALTAQPGAPVQWRRNMPTAELQQLEQALGNATGVQPDFNRFNIETAQPVVRQNPIQPYLEPDALISGEGARRREPNQSLRTIRRRVAETPAAATLQQDQRNISEFGMSGVAPAPQRPFDLSRPEYGRVPELSDAPDGMSLDQFLEWQDSFRSRPMPENLAPGEATDWIAQEEKRLQSAWERPVEVRANSDGSLAAAVARPNRIQRRQERRRQSQPSDFDF